MLEHADAGILKLCCNSYSMICVFLMNGGSLRRSQGLDAAFINALQLAKLTR
jgi:hypothetical protein